VIKGELAAQDTVGPASAVHRPTYIIELAPVRDAIYAEFDPDHVAQAASLACSSVKHLD